MSYRVIPGTGQTLAIGAASVASSAFGSVTNYVRLAATGACHVEFNGSPTATASSAFIAANNRGEVFRVAPGSKVAVIQDGTSTGNLSVVELCL